MQFRVENLAPKSSRAESHSVTWGTWENKRSPVPHITWCSLCATFALGILRALPMRLGDGSHPPICLWCRGYCSFSVVSRLSFLEGFQEFFFLCQGGLEDPLPHLRFFLAVYQDKKKGKKGRMGFGECAFVRVPPLENESAPKSLNVKTQGWEAWRGAVERGLKTGPLWLAKIGVLQAASLLSTFGTFEIWENCLKKERQMRLFEVPLLWTPS